MAAKKTTAKAKPTKTAKPSFKAPTRAPAGEGSLGGHNLEGDPDFAAPYGGQQVPANQLGADKDVREANREFAKAMNKDGRKRVVMADEAPNVYELRRPTGILRLDAHIGGGFPAGGLSIISGPDNVGKSWLVMKVMAMHQRLYGQRSNCAYAMAEGSFDFKRALQTGLIVSVPDEILSAWNQELLQIGMPGLTHEQVQWYKRQVGGFEILRGGTGEETMHVVNEAVKFNRFGIIGIDSLSIMLPEADEHKDVGERGARAGNANLMTDFIKKYTPNTSGLIEPNPTTVIGIMQVRANNDKANAQPHLQKYIKDWATTGAYAIKHGKLIDVTIWDGQLLRKTVQGATKVYGKTLHWKIEKGKAGCHDNVTGETEFLYPDPANPVSFRGHDDVWGVINLGIANGVFVEERGGIVVYHPMTRQPVDVSVYFESPDVARKAMADYPAFYTALTWLPEFELTMRYFVLAALGVQCLYRPLA
jgi:RecA/RadA recombinase